MKISDTSQSAVPTTQAQAARPRPAAADGEAAAVQRPGRSHIQRDLKHLVRDIRHQVKDEVRELRTAGGSEEQIEAVREAFHDFRDQVQAAFGDAGRGGAFDATAVPEGLRRAMADFTAVLRELNGSAAGPGKLPVPELDLPAGSLVDVTA